ncbi:MAG: IS1634 family transposase, partial [Tissierellia bacterium]|nr:IS1634 family transposase [Tissierellia bacterium]
TRTETISYHPLEPIPLGDLRKNIGYFFFHHLYEKLDITQFFLNRQRNLKIKYKLHEVFHLLVMGRLLFPGSKLKTYRRRGELFERYPFSEDDLYRSLSVFPRYMDDLLLHLHKKVCQHYQRHTELVYYDVTNYYFEIEEETNMKKKGVCKSHSSNPIVQMGLLMDKQGIPITCKLFPCNTNDNQTLLPILDEVRKQFKIGRFIVVADKGLNTSDNVAMAIAKGDGYVFSQSIRKSDKDAKAYCLDPSGYDTFKHLGDTFKIKSRHYPRTLYLEDKDGKKIQHPVDEKQVFFYSEKYALRARAQRQKVLDKAAELIQSPGKYTRQQHYGALKYILGVQVDKKGEIIETKASLQWNEKQILEDEEYDGYYVIVTSEHQLSDQEILSHYRGLWQIEESFRLTKSDLEARPVHVSLEDRICSHFLSCFVALLLLRLLQVETGKSIPAGQLLEAVRNMSGTEISNNLFAFDYYTDIVKKLDEAFDVNSNRRFLNTNEIRALRKQLGCSTTKKIN